MSAALQAWIAGALLVAGSLFILTAALGVLRLPDFYTRMHAASKAGTMGSCLMLIALAIVTSDPAVSLRSLAGVVFFILTVPISSHLLARAAHKAGYALWPGSVRDDLSSFPEGLTTGPQDGSEGQGK
ncbi:MAG: monovalent cation/H(+) antiporter subunit G [Rhizobiaceae bacterium]